jgi:hypothetical protein
VLADDPNTPVDESGGRKERPYDHYVFHDTAPRQGILAHRITNVEGLLGCVGVGGKFMNLDGDIDYEMVESAATLQRMCDTLPKKFLLEITKKYV